MFISNDVVVITSPDGEQIFADNIDNVTFNTDQADSENSKVGRAAVRDTIYIKQQKVTPSYFNPIDNKYYVWSKYDTVKNNYTNVTFDYMNITLSQRDSMLTKVAVDGNIFQNRWKHTITYTITGAEPISVTYRINGVEKTIPIYYGGTYKIEYYTIDGIKDAVASGYSSYWRTNGTIGTLGFNCGTNFMYQNETPAPMSPCITNNGTDVPATLSGVDNTMEYQWAGDAEWTPCTETEISLISSTNALYVRYAAVDGKEASLTKILFIR